MHRVTDIGRPYILVLVGVGTAICGCEPELEAPPQAQSTPPPETIGSDVDKNGESLEDTGRAPQPPFVAMSMGDFNAWWQINVDAKNEPLGSVLEGLFEEVPDWNPKLVIADESVAASNPVLERKVSLSLSGVSVLEAIEWACHAAGVHPRYDADSSSGEDVVELYPTPRVPEGIAVPPGDTSNPPKWIQFAGPVAVILREVQQYPPHTLGWFEMQVVWPQLPAGVAELSDTQPFEIVDVTAEGHDLEDGYYSDEAETASGLCRATVDRRLRHLLRNVPAIDEIRGRIRLEIPTAVETVWFDRVQSERTEHVGDSAVALQRVSKQSGQSEVDYAVTGAAPLYSLREYGFDPAGRLLEAPSAISNNSNRHWNRDKGDGNATRSFDGDLAKLAVVLVNGREVFEREIVFEDIPLSESGSQPEKLKELTHAGHDVPLDVEVLGLKETRTYPEVRLAVLNHSNKAVYIIGVKFNYLDSEGRRIDTWRSSLRRDDDLDDPARP